MPGTRCTVAVCNNSHSQTKLLDNTISYHRFPKNKELRARWVHNCKRDGVWNPDTSHVCSTHFLSNDFIRDFQNELLGLPLRRMLKPEAFPSINLGTGNIQSGDISIRSERLEKRTTVKDMRRVLNLSQERNIMMSDLIEMQENNEVDLATENQELKIENDVLKRRINEMEEDSQNKAAQIEELKVQLAYAELKENSLNRRQESLDVAEKAIDKLLSKNQFDLLTNKKIRVTWEPEEIKLGFTLRYLGTRTYDYLREKLHYPLPCHSTLLKYASRFKMSEGILMDSLDYMKICSNNLSELEKMAVIQFDEMKVKSLYEYDEKEDRIVGRHKQVQVVMARGLFGSWKQPVYMGYDKKMTAELLKDVISKLYSAGFLVVAFVCDCAGGNVGLWKSLNLTLDKTSFVHPNVDSPVFYFPDAPHLLKLCRNWLLDYGFRLPDGRRITKEPLVELVDIGRGLDIRSTFKLTDEHLSVEKTQRQGVRMAAQTLSHTVANAVSKYTKLDESPSTAEFLSTCDKWFALMNSYTPNPLHKNAMPHEVGYGLNLEEQNKLLADVREMIGTMRAKDKKTDKLLGLQIFQKAIIMSTKSLEGLFEFFKIKGVKYILTHRVNQDCLENLFSQVRARGGLNDHPTPLEFKHRLRLLILGKNTMTGKNPNTLGDSNECFLVDSLFKATCGQVDIENPPDEFSENKNDEVIQTGIKRKREEEHFEVINVSEECGKDGFEYISGWLAKRFRKQYPDLDLGAPTAVLDKIDFQNNFVAICKPWIRQLSFGGLIEPSPWFFERCCEMEEVFQSIYGPSSINNKTINVVKEMSEKFLGREDFLPEPIIKCFFKFRIRIRINYCNYISDYATKLNNVNKKTKECKKMDKIRS